MQEWVARSIVRQAVSGRSLAIDLSSNEIDRGLDVHTPIMRIVSVGKAARPSRARTKKYPRNEMELDVCWCQAATASWRHFTASALSASASFDAETSSRPDNINQHETCTLSNLQSAIAPEWRRSTIIIFFIRVNPWWLKNYQSELLHLLGSEPYSFVVISGGKNYRAGTVFRGKLRHQ